MLRTRWSRKKKERGKSKVKEKQGKADGSFMLGYYNSLNDQLPCF